MERQDLERMTREQLIAQAERLGIPRPRVLTQPELVDEIIGRTTKGERERAKARGWLGRARDLLATVVEKGLHLPEAARALRQEEKSWPAPPPPLPTVTLAEIYAAQGHFERALAVLDEVLAREPDHREARALRERFVEQAQRARSRVGRDKESFPAVKESVTPPKEAARSKGPTAKSSEGSTSATPVVAEAKPLAGGARPVSVEAKPVVVEAQAVAARSEAVRVETRSEVAETQPRETATPPAIVDAPRAAAESDVEIPSTERAPAVAAPTERAPAVAAPTDALEEPPLPQRYEVDEVVAIAVDPRTIYLYWEVRPTTLARARARRPDGALCVRLASVTASWEGPVVDTRDVQVDALYGDRFVRDVQPGSNVRVSVGWKSAEGFEPFAVGADVMAPRMVPVESVSQEVARWEAEPVAPFNAWRVDASVSPAPREGGDAMSPQRRTPPFVERARASAGATFAGLRGPVDTGVESWFGGGDQLELVVVPPGEAPQEGEQMVETAWYQPGGASELGRAAPGRVLAWRRRSGPPGPARTARLSGPGDLVFGGASELARG